MSGFDWLNIAGLQSDSDLPPPPVSFGVTPTSSSSSLNLKSQSTPAVSQLESKLEETVEDLSVPLSLRADQLTKDEAKTYLRWYNDLVVRRGTNLIRLDDVFQFLRNFSIDQRCKDLLTRIFREVNALNLGEFFAFLRVISHTILGKIPTRRLIMEPAPIPKPKSILSAKRLKDQEEEEEHEEHAPNGSQPPSFDLDSFTQMLLTGEDPAKKNRKKKKGHSKRIKFSDQVSVEPTEMKSVEPVKIDLSLPMDQLLNQMPKKPHTQAPSINVNEEEELREMQDAFSHFQNIKNVDSALIHGTPSNIPSIFFDEVNGAGSPSLQSPSPDPSMRPLAPNHTGPVLPMAPSHTGPVRLLSPSHTGPVPFANSLLQANYTGMASSQDQNGYLQPFATGSYRVGSASPSIQRDGNTPPVAPPTRRSRSVSSPIPLDNQHVSLEQLAQSVAKDRVVSDPPMAHPVPQQPTLAELQAQRMVSPSAPAPPPPRRRGLSQPPVPPPSRSPAGPPLPPKIGLAAGDLGYNNYQQFQPQEQHQSAADILGDLKALQSEVDRLQFYQN